MLGSGALAAGAGAQAAGAGGVVIGGSNTAPVNTVNTGGGAIFFSPVNAGRDVMGRDKLEVAAPPAAPAAGGEHAAQQLAHQQLLQLAALQAQLLQHACRQSQPLVVEVVQGLQAEAAKPAAQREPGLVQHLLRGLVDLVPAGVGAVVSAFATPVLGALAGPATAALLARWQGKTGGHRMSRAKQPADLSLDDLDRQIAELQARRDAAVARADKSSASAPVGGASAPAGRITKRRAKPAAPMVQTGGGAVFKQQVTTRSGHVIGRDFVQLIEQMPVQGEDPTHNTLALASYLHALSVDLAGLKLGDIDASPDQMRQDPLQLVDIYVPLNTTVRLSQETSLAELLRADNAGELLQPSKASHFAALGLLTRPATAIEALATHRCLTLLGAPGSGKSTFGAHVLLCMAQAWQGRAAIDKLMRKPWQAGALLPVRVAPG